MENTDKAIQFEERIRQLFRVEEQRSEKLVNYARIGLSLMYVGAVFGAKKQIPYHSFLVGFIAGLLSLVVSLVMLWYLGRGNFGRRLKYVLTTFDILVVSTAIWAFGTFRTFKTPVFVIYFIWLGMAAMRFSMRLTLYAGIVAAVSYIFILVHRVLFGGVELGTLTESYISSKVSLMQNGLQTLFFIGYIVIAVYVSRGYYRLVRKSLEHEIEVEKERKEKSEVRDAFSRYVTQQVADVILKEGVNLRGEVRNATVLFCDIREFTRMSDGLQPAEVVTFLNEYLSLMIDVIFEYEGTLDKFVGDEIMAVFGVPVSRGNDTERAMKAALKMRSILADLNNRRARDGKEAIRFGIGIHTGEVIAGNIGSEKRMEYTVIGRTVNLASRIEALNKKFGSDILITQDTYDRVKDMVKVEKMAPAQIKGVTETVHTYSVLGAA